MIASLDPKLRIILSNYVTNAKDNYLPKKFKIKKAALSGGFDIYSSVSGA